MVESVSKLPTELQGLALHAAQVSLEQESITTGIERYREALKDGDDTLPPGMKLIKAAIIPLSEAIRKAVAASKAGKAGRSTGVYKFIDQFDSDAVAFVVARRVMHSITEHLPIQTVAGQIATSLEDCDNHDALKVENPRLYRLLLRRLKVVNKETHRHIILRAQQKYAGVTAIKWGLTERVRLGTVLIHLMAEATGLIELVRTSRTKHDTPTYVVATLKTLEWLEQGHARSELMAPAFMPMVIRPEPWTTPYDGGYLSAPLRYPLIKTANKQYLSELENWDMADVYTAINALQDTRWAVNKGVLHVAREVWDGGGRLGKLPRRDNEELPAKSHDPDVDKEAHKVWRRLAAHVYDRNIRSLSKRLSVESKLMMAEKMGEYEAFYFPHALDWRGRAYPVSAHYNPQGDDLAKSMLQFAEGKPLGDTGATWLAVHGANCYGVDKVDFTDRVQWVRDNQDAILDCAVNPLDGSRFWSTAGSPYQFLAFCFEWAGYIMQGNGYVSHLPVSWDGSCNGLQNFSAMLRDEVGGAATNLIPAEKPSDIYMAVAFEAEKLVAVDAAAGIEVASRWVGNVTRKVTKRNTMTVPYGVTRRGMKAQLVTEFNKAREEGEPLNRRAEDDWEDGAYLAEKNHEAIGLVVVAARAAMDWLQKAARVVAADGLPIRWVTPAGLLVQQDYRELVGHKADFTVAGRRYQMVLQITGARLDKRKQGAGISPNFIHSLDAAHMMRTVNYCVEAGLTSFAMVHDSFGSHAADAEELSYQLRLAFVHQYQDDVLGNFREQLMEQIPYTLAAKIPPLPPMGTLMLEGVMQSDYFFA